MDRSATQQPPVDHTESLDWLEGIHDEKALEWVRKQNAVTEGELYDANFEATAQRIQQVLDATDKIPMVTKRGEYYYNFWRDADHRLGVWRRTDWQSYRSSNPRWQVLIDFDDYARNQEQDWHFAGAQLLRTGAGEPYRRALIRMSPDGGDQVMVREFDLASLEFVPDGFELPVAKTSVSWVDEDTILVASATNEQDTTRSTYARCTRRLKRGQQLAAAETIFEVDVEHVGGWAHFDSTPGFERIVTTDAIDFYNSVTGVIWDDTHQIIKVPTDVRVLLHRQWVLFAPQTDWNQQGTVVPAGALAITELSSFLDSGDPGTLVFTPDEHTSLESFSFTAGHLLITLLRDVASEVQVVDLDSGFASSTLPVQGDFLSVSVSAVDDEDEQAGEDYWMTVTGFTQPTTLLRGRVGGQAEVIKRSPERFDSAGLSVTQHFAVSADGTRVPYFQVADEQLVLDGKNPVLMDGYGGFQVSLTPGYSPSLGTAWLNRRTAQGRRAVYVLTNIRGGGEYGPKWHRAALQQNRHRAYEDFAAIAEDLVARKVTSRSHLAATGRSNGGLLMGNMITGYPQLFGAISCGVPLLDMKRYTRLSAGHSWIAEYGDPEIPEQWEYVRTFSPLHRLDDQPHPAQDYPKSLIWTTTTDDRVGPVQARKMAARMLEKGISSTRYHEPEDGGHAGSTDNASTARMLATSYEFLWRAIQ